MDVWLLETFRWTDVVDIGLMTWVVYRALLVMRGTRAIQTMVGLLVLIGLYALADQLELISIHWLLEKFFVYIVLAVIILFQQDIRKALARAGGRLFFATSRNSASLSLPKVEELVRASFAMASRRVGALIAIERAGSLAEFVEPATALDAEISNDLLLSIFHPTSPLHDGAVIIQKGRIAAASAFLPLTQNKNVSRFFGTRHRAAIGLTEETDTVVIIVSEERGVVSLVQNGQLTPCDDANDLREKLQRLLNTDDDATGSTP
jgi:diadenylate cyclase